MNLIQFLFVHLYIVFITRMNNNLISFFLPVIIKQKFLLKTSLLLKSYNISDYMIAKISYL